MTEGSQAARLTTYIHLSSNLPKKILGEITARFFVTSRHLIQDDQKGKSFKIGYNYTWLFLRKNRHFKKSIHEKYP